jgi:hypothetical protein
MHTGLVLKKPPQEFRRASVLGVLSFEGMIFAMLFKGFRARPQVCRINKERF